ncbi:hypothetical protein KUV62_18480 [Salipiger bermudensis]|uniref:hypothetical protein n=1 Tax=Salipiger bermudensis TaxID=344736 RepID=UPI001C9A03BE|nr:hypothetical protein [Salipiger bermudensis]MBY6005913.1 hypothetical protein [Salipiger bermudensis]
MKHVLIALALWLCAVAGSATAQSCPEIRFARGASSGEVSGRVTDNAPLCFVFGTGAGQTARLQLLGSDNTCFTIPGVTDCQQDFSFRTSAGTYRVNVFQLFRAPAYEQFALRLSIR